ncbi:MAG TPA: hypothetical protein VFS01_03920 [Rhizomicrobium sp.]|nr:hypothetical protein [Rhizomicrobium sp.]
MFNMKTALAAAALAAITAAGTVSASADPVDRHLNRVEHRLERRDARIDRRIDRIDHRIARHDMHRHYVERARVNRILLANHYRMIGEPYFLGGRYVVRTHDRFGRVVLVRIDPWTGAFMGVVRL